ncbi:MAG: sulfurtransferase [Anaerolineales bacterium]
MDRSYPYGTGAVKWISTEWLEDQLTEGVEDQVEQKKFVILDCQPNVHDYIKEHIPGAVYMNEGLLRVPREGLPAQYVDPEVMENNLRRIGVEADRPVVVYTGTGPFKGWGDGLEQTMMAYTLARFGHENVYILDGGIDKWKAEERPLSQVFPELEPSGFDVEVQSEFYVEYEAFQNIKDDEDVVLLDARPEDVYAGQGPWIKAGHIPGAINLPWKRLMDADNARLLKSDEEIGAILEEHGVTRDKLVICSCGTGREATNEFILLNWYLEFPRVRIYEGSFTEWSSYPDNPTVIGSEPR